MLTKANLEAVAYLYKLPEDISVASGAADPGLYYMRELEKRDIFSSSNLDGLRKLLSSIERCDLREMVEDFERDKQRHSGRNQHCTRPDEEHIRLNTSYAQAKKTEEQLTEFQKEFAAFCSKHGNPPAARQFYTGMVKRLMEMKESCHKFITVPLYEVIHSSYCLMPTQPNKDKGLPLGEC